MLSPDEPHFLLNRANTLVMLGRLEEADAVYEQVIVRSPRCITPICRRAWRRNTAAASTRRAH